MKYVSEKYEKQLDNLAELLRRPIGDAALQDTIEFEPVQGRLFDLVELGDGS